MLVLSNKLKQECVANEGEYYMDWKQSIFGLKRSTGRDWQYALPSPGKVHVGDELLTIKKK